jgi:hypothetical protein
MRQMLSKNFFVLRNMLSETHLFYELLLLTRDYKTSRAAHERLEDIMKRECEKMMIIDHGLQILPDTVLRIANAEKFKPFLQSELKAIKDGLVYVEDKSF